jgi:hypothetical protein
MEAKESCQQLCCGVGNLLPKLLLLLLWAPWVRPVCHVRPPHKQQRQQQQQQEQVLLWL